MDYILWGDYADCFTWLSANVSGYKTLKVGASSVHIRLDEPPAVSGAQVEGPDKGHKHLQNCK